jgi:hypothetical protein
MSFQRRQFDSAPANSGPMSVLPTARIVSCPLGAAISQGGHGLVHAGQQGVHVDAAGRDQGNAAGMSLRMV